MKTALVTGANRGLGFEISKQLATKGMHVVLAGRTLKKAETAAQMLKDLKLDVSSLAIDVTDSASVEQAFTTLSNEFNHLDVLVNNAGVAPLERKDILESTEESYERVMKINLQGPYFLTQSVANMMIEQKEKEPESCLLSGSFSYCFFRKRGSCYSGVALSLINAWKSIGDCPR